MNHLHCRQEHFRAINDRANHIQANGSSDSAKSVCCLVKQYADRGACYQVQSVLAKLSLCRTHAMGGKNCQCDDCDEVTQAYHSSGDRQGPWCSGCKRYDFAKRAEQLTKTRYFGGGCCQKRVELAEVMSPESSSQGELSDKSEI